MKSINNTSSSIISRSEIADVSKEFEKFFAKNAHSSLEDDQFTLRTYDALGSQKTAIELLADIEDHLKFCQNNDNDCAEFVAIFPKRKYYTEAQFEKLLWKQLRYLHLVDIHPWKKQTAHELKDDQFFFSVLGKSFYVIGMHPSSEQKNRKSPYPAMIFSQRELSESFSRKRKITAINEFNVLQDHTQETQAIIDETALKLNARQYGRGHAMKVLRKSQNP